MTPTYMKATTRTPKATYPLVRVYIPFKQGLAGKDWFKVKARCGHSEYLKEMGKDGFLFLVLFDASEVTQRQRNCSTFNSLGVLQQSAIQEAYFSFLLLWTLEVWALCVARLYNQNLNTEVGAAVFAFCWREDINQPMAPSSWSQIL